MPEAALLEPPTSTRSRVTPGLVENVEANARAVLAVFTALYAFGFWVSASHKPFWFDEIFTFELAQLPRISDIWQVLRQGIELNPPLLFWATWLLHRLFGGGPVVTRLPAALGYWVMTLCLYHFVRRRTRPVYGLFAALFPLFTFAGDFSVEARGYGFELGFAGLALLCWQCAVDRVRRPFALLGLALTLACALSSHYYAAYLIGALLAGELARFALRRSIDLPCVLAILSGGLPLLAFRPLLGAVATGSQHFWIGSPSVGILARCYAGIVTPVLLVGLPLLVYLSLHSPAKLPTWTPREGLAAWEVAAAGMLALMPALVFLAGFFVHVALFDRYVILAVPGFAILSVCVLYRLTAGSSAVANLLLRTGACLCLLPWCIWQAVTVMVAPGPAQTESRQAVMPTRKDLPVVVADEAVFLEHWFYSSSQTKQQFLALIDYQAAARYANNDTGQRTMGEGRRWWPIPAIDYRDFVSQHPEFLLARLSSHADWIAQKLLADNADLRLIEIHRDLGLFAPETQVFLVTTKPSASR